MIFGIGTDIVRVARMQKNLDRYGERFAERILAESERPGFHDTRRKAHYLAKRFAAKEAAAKAMGTGFTAGLAFHHIAVDHEPAGRPILAFSGQAAEFMQAHAIGSAHLSLSDEDEYAIAYVVLVRDEERGTRSQESRDFGSDL